MPKFTVCIRAIKHLTRELTIEARTAAEAENIACGLENILWDESEPEDFQVESVTPEPEPVFLQLPSAEGNRSQHFDNLNHKPPLGKFWRIDETIYEEFLNMLPPAYCAGGFRLIEKLTGDIAATFLRVGPDYWCGYTDRETVEPHRLLNHIHDHRS